MTEMKDSTDVGSTDESTTDTTEITIVKYNEKLAAGMAEMFNGWDDLWPGGYTQGVPYDEDRVKKTFNKSSALAIFLAIDGEKNKPIGMCTLHKHWRDREAAYVGTLGVSPEALSKKVGKRLLLRALEYSRAKGYTRVDLNTWAGNMRAVPLYKKVGLMWNPQGDGLTMEDYVPEILEHSISKPFFEGLEKHSWYDLHVREITQAPDEYEEDGMMIYPYRFEKGEDSISVVIDRQSRSITSIERIIGGEKLRAKARVSQHLIICGVPEKYSLELTNETSSDVKVKIDLEGFESLHFDGSSKKKGTIKAGDSLSWEIGFHLDATAPLHRSGVKTPSIVAKLEIDGVSSVLRTGMIIHSAAEVRTRWGASRITPSGKAVVPITIINHSPENMDGILHFDVPEHLSISPTESEIQIPSTGLGGSVIEIEATEDLPFGTHDLWAYLKVHLNGSDVEIITRKYRIPIYCLGNSHVAIGEDDRLRRLSIADPNYTATFAREGAAFRVAGYDDMNSFRISSQIGPPFGLSTFRFAERDVDIKEDESETTVVMKAKHPEKPLIIEDRAMFEHGTGIVKHEVWVTNTSTEVQSLQVRLQGSGGIALAPGKITIPLQSGIIEENIGNALLGYPSLPGAPAAFSEGWIAITQNSGVRGQFWDLSELDEIRIGMTQMSALHYPDVTVDVGETKRLSRVWIVTNASDWRDVQRLWKERVAKAYDRLDAETPVLRSMIELESKPVVIPHVQQSTVEFNVHKRIVAPLPVDLSFVSPEGWTSVVTSSAGESDDTTLSNYMLQDKEVLSLSLTPGNKVPDGFAVHKGESSLVLGIKTTHPYTLIQLGTKDAKVDLTESEDQGSKVFTVNNGLCEFTVSPDYGGCMTSLKNKDGTELLISAFPTATAKPGGFLENYYGGVQPVVWDDGMDVDLMKAQTNKEHMTGKSCSIGIWKGVEIEWTGAVQDITRGINFRLQYLTVPGSPMVVVRWVIKNPTSAPIRFIPSLFLDPAFDGKLEGYRMITEWEGEMAEITPAKFPMSVVSSKNFIWLKNSTPGKKTEGLALLTQGTEPGLLGLSISTYLLTGTMDLKTLILPGEEKVITSCLHVDPTSVSDMTALQESLEYLISE